MGDVSKAIEQYSAIIADMTDTNGITNWPRGGVIKTVHSAEHVRVLRLFCKVVLDTGLTCKETKILLSNRYMKVADIPRYLYSNMGISVTKENVRNKVTRDIKAIEEVVGKNFVVDAILYGNNMSRYETVLIKELVKHKYDPLGGTVALKLGYQGSVQHAGTMDQRVIQTVEEIKPYIIRNMKEVAEKLDYGALNYIRYQVLMGDNESGELFKKLFSMDEQK